MKKNYFMLAAATMMLAACAETGLVDELVVEETQQAIGFEAFPEKATRAEIAGLPELQTVGFQVWGYKYPSTADGIVWGDNLTTEDVTEELNYYTVFNGINVTYAESKWGYTDTQYWDENCKYNFYAVSPMNGNYSIDKGMITISGIASSKSSASNDYLIDRNGAVGCYGSAANAVAFEFNHIMSKLSFKLMAGVEEEITVTNLQMVGWNANTAQFTQSLVATPSDADDTSEWEFLPNPDSYSSGTITLVGDGTGDETIVLPANQSVMEVADTYIMVPQSIAANELKFIISYTIGSETFTAQVGEVAQAQTWGTDAHTTYTITVAPNAISFDTTHTVGGWSNSNPNGSATIQ